MFAQGQLLGMKSDLLMRLKTEINAWDKVAERHPYAHYRRNEMPSFVEQRKEDPYTTNFGEGLPFRTFDRNRRARETTQMTRLMEQPYPVGYTGHVTKIRHVVGQTYGREVRDAINSVTSSTDLVAVKPVETPTDWNCVPDRDRLVSTQGEAYIHPDRQVADAKQRLAHAVSTRRPVDNNSRYASSSQLSFEPPPKSCYNTPAWSERPTSNIGQFDPYKHGNSHIIHQAKLPSRLQGSHGGGTITQHSDALSQFLNGESTSKSSA
mmetsp:Transcript_4449/g.11693  ORF Transcript_4449/g.11693 Transcript_4449/m.11693 type:complete len:265 (+) Transcript_4449:91-885(+)